MKIFFLGAWIGATLVLAFSGFSLSMVVWGAATFAGWAILEIVERD